MDLMTPVVAGALLALFTAIQTWINKGRFDVINRRLEQMAGDITQIRSEMAQIRSDLLQVVLALKPQQGTG